MLPLRLMFVVCVKFSKLVIWSGYGHEVKRGSADREPTGSPRAKKHFRMPGLERILGLYFSKKHYLPVD